MKPQCRFPVQSWSCYSATGFFAVADSSLTLFEELVSCLGRVALPPADNSRGTAVIFSQAAITPNKFLLRCSCQNHKGLCILEARKWPAFIHLSLALQITTAFSSCKFRRGNYTMQCSVLKGTTVALQRVVTSNLAGDFNKTKSKH